MTVQSGPTEVQYEGNGVTTIYIFQFQMLDASHIRTTVDGVVLDPSEFTVTLNDNNIGGQVEYNVAPADGVEIFIARQTPDNQLASYPTYTPMPAKVVEFGLDKLTMQTQELETSSGLTQEEIDILRALFESLDIRVTVNEEDIVELDIRVTITEAFGPRIDDLETNEADWINRNGDSMVGQLKVLFAPEADLDAVSNIFMRNFITALIEGLVLLGFYDASGNVNPVDGDETGEFYIIALAGTLNVSDGISAPTPTLVNVGDYIIWSDSTQAPPLDEVWVHIPRLIASAAGVAFDPTGTDYTATNVQDALVESEDLFVRKIGNHDETMNGVKTFIDVAIFAAGLQLNNNNQISFLIDGDTDPEADGVTRLFKQTDGTFAIQQRLAGIWEDVAAVQVGTNRMHFDTSPTSGEAADSNNELMRFQETVRTSGNQTGITGDKTWEGQQAIINTIAQYLLGTGAGGGAGNDASGTFRTLTDDSDITQFQKRNTIGTAWIDVLDIGANGWSTFKTNTVHELSLIMANQQAISFRNAAEETTGLGSQRFLMGTNNLWAHEWHDGADWQSRHRIFEDGSQQFDGTCTFNDALAATSLTVSATSTFTGIADFIAVPTCSTNATTSDQLTNLDTVDKHAFGNHEATEADALQASIDNPNEIFYADQGS